MGVVGVCGAGTSTAPLLAAISQLAKAARGARLLLSCDDMQHRAQRRSTQSKPVNEMDVAGDSRPEMSLRQTFGEVTAAERNSASSRQPPEFLETI